MWIFFASDNLCSCAFSTRHVPLFPFNYFLGYLLPLGISSLPAPLFCRWPFPFFSPFFCGVEHTYFWKDFLVKQDYSLWLGQERNGGLPSQVRFSAGLYVRGTFADRRGIRDDSSLVWRRCQAWVVVVVSCLHLVFKTIQMTRRKAGDFLLPSWWVLVKNLIMPVLDVSSSWWKWPRRAED